MAKYDYGGGCPCGLYRECERGCAHKNRLEAKMKKDPADFGFTFVGDEDLQSPVDDRAERLRSMVMPLLLNLKSNPEKDVIKWSGTDRVKKIDEFIKKMDDLVDGND